MKNIIKVFKDNRVFIRTYLTNVLDEIQKEEFSEELVRNIKNGIKSYKSIYFLDDNFLISSPFFQKEGKNDEERGISKKHYFETIDFNSKGCHVTSPYISSNQGSADITLIIKLKKGYVVIDISIIELLEELKLVSNHQNIMMINMFIYGLFGFSLLGFSIFLGIYGIYNFYMAFQTKTILDSTFTSIISITLGLAIFDLAKTISEHEILYKQPYEKTNQNKVFNKFLNSILIALLIETMMVVFKVTLHNYADFVYAFLLITGVSTLIYVAKKTY